MVPGTREPPVSRQREAMVRAWALRQSQPLRAGSKAARYRCRAACGPCRRRARTRFRLFVQDRRPLDEEVPDCGKRIPGRGGAGGCRRRHRIPQSGSAGSCRSSTSRPRSRQDGGGPSSGPTPGTATSTGSSGATSAANRSSTPSSTSPTPSSRSVASSGKPGSSTAGTPGQRNAPDHAPIRIRVPSWPRSYYSFDRRQACG